MYTKKIGMLVILSLSIATIVMGTEGLNLVSPVFAGGDHHDDGGKFVRTTETTIEMTRIKQKK